MSTTGAVAAEGLSTRRRWSAVLVLSASLLVINLDLTILNIALPEIAMDLHASGNQLLWIVDAYSLVLAGLLVSTASLGDRWGRRRMLLTGYVVFGAASALVVVADSAGTVIGLRVLLGIGGAMIMPTTLSMIRTIFTDPAERAKALGVWAAVSGLGAAIGPIAGGVLMEHFSWHAAFLVNVPVMLLALVGAALILPESKVASPGRWDYLAAVLSMVGMVLLVWAIKRFAKAESLVDAEGLLAFAAAALLLTAFVVRSLRRPDPLLDVRLFRLRPFTSGVLAAVGSMFALAAALLLLAQWLQLVEGHSPIGAGMRLLPLSIAALVSSVLAAPLASRIGARAVLAGGLAVAGLGMVWVFLVPGELTYSGSVVGMIMVSSGIGSLAIASAMIMSGTPPDKAGNAAAMEETAYELGAVLGVAILGSVAALLYRGGLRGSGVLDSLDPTAAHAVEESIGGAVAVADRLGLPDVAARAASAFTDALQVTSLVGGLALLAVSVAVFLLVPRGTDITEQVH